MLAASSHRHIIERIDYSKVKCRYALQAQAYMFIPSPQLNTYDICCMYNEPSIQGQLLVGRVSHTAIINER